MLLKTTTTRWKILWQVGTQTAPHHETTTVVQFPEAFQTKDLETFFLFTLYDKSNKTHFTYISRKKNLQSTDQKGNKHNLIAIPNNQMCLIHRNNINTEQKTRAVQRIRFHCKRKWDLKKIARRM